MAGGENHKKGAGERMRGFRRIGIIGGLSPESTAYYYRKYIEFSQQMFGPRVFPDLVVYSVNFGEFFAGTWDIRKDILIKAARALEKAGVEVAGIASNTPHMVFSDVADAVEMEMVSIINVVADEALRREMRRLLLLGTQTTMSQPFYRDALRERGVEVVVPSEEEMAEVNRIITDELMFSDTRSKWWAVDLIEKYASQAGVDGVVLGCTELPLLIHEGDVSVGVINSAAVHMRALLERAVSPGEEGSG